MEYQKIITLLDNKLNQINQLNLGQKNGLK